MTKLVYRGVSYEKETLPSTDHHHEQGLRYRGYEFDGVKAEADAKAKPAGRRRIYRGVDAGTDREPK